MPSFDYEGTTLAYRDTGGDGTPVLLVHGYPFDSRMWDPQVDALGGRFRLIVPDLKGCGASDGPEDRSEYSVDRFADELRAVLDDAGADRAVVAGLSMGGYITLAFWRKYPERVHALVLADTRAEADTPEAVEKRSAHQKQVADEGIGGLVEALPGALLSEATRSKKPDVVETLKKIMQQPAPGYIGSLEAMKTRPDSTPTLTSINVPTLVIVGENDQLTPPEASRKIHEHIGGSKLVVLPEAGHVTTLEAPEAFNGALAEFLDAV